MWSYSQGLVHAFRRPIFLYLGALSFSVMGVAAGIFYAIERPANTNLGSFLDALYFVVTTMTGVGYGDITPVTSVGKIFSILLMLLGTAIFVAFTAAIATALIEFELGSSNENEK